MPLEVVMTTKGEIRKQRKAARVAGRPWSVETGPSGLEIVREETHVEKRRRERGLAKWARRYDELNGAPESEEDC